MINEPSPQESLPQSAPGYSRVYRLPQHPVYLEAVVFAVICALCIFALIPALISFLNYGTVLPSAKRAAFFLCLTALLVRILEMVIKRELGRVRFVLTEEALIRETSLRRRVLRFSAVDKLLFVSFPPAGGIVVLQGGGGQSLTVPLTLEHVDDLTRRIEALVPVAVGGESGERADLWHRVHRGCAAAEAGRRRASVMRKPLLEAVTMIVAVNFLVGAIYWNMPVVPLLLWVVAGPLFPIAGYAGSDLFMKIRDRGRITPGNVKGLSFDEQRTVAVAAMLCTAVYLVAGILCRAFMS